MAETVPLAFNVSVPSDGLQGRSRLEKPLHKWLDGSDEAGRRLKYVLWGPRGVGKSTLALKFAAGQAKRGDGWLRLVFRLSASSMEQDYAGLLEALLGKSAGAPSYAEVRGRVHELLQSPAWSRAWLAVLDDLPAPADDELERAGLGWLMGGFPWAHGRSIITTRAAEWVHQGEDSREVSATDLQHCDSCGAGSLTMLKCGKCRLVYYCSIDCQKAARSKHKIVCVPKRNMDDVMGLSVGSFAEDEACSWVKSTVRQWRDDDAGVLELVRYLGCLPRTIGLASAHACVHGTASPAEFLAALKRAVPPPYAQLEVGGKVELHSLNATEFNGKHGELLDYDAEAQRWAVELSEGGIIRVRAQNLASLSRDDCPPSLHAVVMLSRGKIQESGDGEAAEAALCKMALLDTTAIPLDLLSSTERKAVQVLKQHALVTVDDKNLVAIDSLTQLAVRAQTDKGDRRAIAAGVVRALKERLAKFNHLKPSTFFIGRRYAAHARAAAANAATWGLIPGFRLWRHQGAGGGGEARGGRRLLRDMQGMCMSAGLFLQTVGQFQQAWGMYEFTLVCTLALEDHDSPNVAASYDNMGAVLEKTGKYEEALELHRKSFEIKTRIHGGDSNLNVAATYNNVANIYQAQGKYEKALEMYTKSLDIMTRILGGDSHLLVAQTQENMANIYYRQGHYDLALEIYKSVLETKIRVCSQDSLDVAASYNGLGLVYNRLGQYERALEYYQKDLDITIKISGQRCPSVADSFHNMANIYEAQGKYEEALELQTKSLEIRTCIYGGDSHPSVADSFHNMANIYQTLGKYEEALELNMKSLEIRTRIYGGDSHPDVAATYQNLGLLYKSQGNQVQRREMATKAYHIYLKTLGPDHPTTQGLKPFVNE
jgi:tetratricopeptide (TPR) repeat protein